MFSVGEHLVRSGVGRVASTVRICRSHSVVDGVRGQVAQNTSGLHVNDVMRSVLQTTLDRAELANIASIHPNTLALNIIIWLPCNAFIKTTKLNINSLFSPYLDSLKLQNHSERQQSFRSRILRIHITLLNQNPPRASILLDHSPIYRLLRKGPPSTFAFFHSRFDEHLAFQRVECLLHWHPEFSTWFHTAQESVFVEYFEENVEVVLKDQ